MAARPIDAESRRRPLCIAVALVLVMAAVLLVAGCTGWNGGRIQRDQDIRITKLNSDGVMEWITLIDTGNYDFGLDFTQTPDGGFVVVGGTTKLVCQNFPQAPDIPQLTRLSATGETSWTRDYPFHIVEVIPNRNGNISAISDKGKILPLDTTGAVIQEYDPGISRNPKGIWEYNHSFTSFADGNYLFQGSVIIKVNNSQNFSWLRINGTTINRIFSLTYIPDSKGYLLLVNDETGAEILRSDAEGNILGAVSVPLFSNTPKPEFYQTSEGFAIVLDHFGLFRGYQLDRDGMIKNNITISSRDAIVPSVDGGFIDIGIADPGDRITKTKYYSNGTIASEKTSRCSAKVCPTLSGDIIRTSDGGFAIMSLIQKEKEC